MITDNKMKTAIIASATGTLLEWYDLFLAVILAKLLSSQLFPPNSDTAFLETLAIVGSSFFVRPIGSLFFGSIGDRKGRKKSFLLSLMLMGGATFFIGLIPTFSQIGWGAPIILLVLRLAQGFALSGEYSGAIVYVAENAPAKKRGYYTGFIQATVPAGLLLCLFVVIGVQFVMSPEDFIEWGWRLPFLSSAFLVFFSYMARQKMDETPVYLEMKASGNLSKSPVKESLNSWKKIKLMLMLIFGGNAAQSTIMQTSQFVTLYFLQLEMKVDEFTSFMVLALAMLLGMPFFQWAGAWSDEVGRKKVIFMGICLGLISIPVSFYVFNAFGNPDGLSTAHGLPLNTTVLFIFMAFINMIASALVYGPMGIFVMEYFESKVRYTSMGFTHNIGNGLIGGATPLVTEFLKANILVGAALTPFVGLIYPMGLVLLAFIINPFLKENKD